MIVEYIWLDGNLNLRSKTRVCNEITDWNYDGSSTNQAEGHDSEITLNPVFICNDPLRNNNSKLALCQTFNVKGEPALNNHRHLVNQWFNQKLDEEPWYGLEQEYFIIDPKTNLPLGLSDIKQGQFYCSVGFENAFGRKIAEKHLMACYNAGLTISGINAEVAPGQWEFQIGPVEGIKAGDMLWVARYLLLRIAEEEGYMISFHPKPVLGDWNGSGCHTNYSTKKMREENGLDEIENAINKLALNHLEHIKVYGKDNHLRLTGKHETSSMDKFSHGRANRGASVRIGNDTINNKKGYFEDRRPSSNCDPYLVTGYIFKTTCL